MKLYAFELGREHELCLEELLTVFPNAPLVAKSSKIAVFELPEIENPKKLQNHLGGTIRIIEILERNPRDLRKAIESTIRGHFKDQTGKIPFAISPIGFPKNHKLNIRDFLNFSKKIIKSFGLNCRFVNKNFETPKPSTIFKAKVVEKGIDICIIDTQDFFVGKTIAIQNVNEYSLRDFDKPKRDARVGMLPPKLAQIMINLAGDADIIYDPFCGTGTVLIEGMLMRKKLVIGSDIEERLTGFSLENCEWTERQFQTDTPFRLLTKDARRINETDLKGVTAIITESYLGPPRISLPSQAMQNNVFQELSQLHESWLNKAHQFSGPDLKIVMCIPNYQSNQGRIPFPSFPKLARKAGFNFIKSFAYGREGQTVVREVVILEKISAEF